jgi:hypothetical protein
MSTNTHYEWAKIKNFFSWKKAHLFRGVRIGGKTTTSEERLKGGGRIIQSFLQFWFGKFNSRIYHFINQIDCMEYLKFRKNKCWKPATK